jgi:RHS repeat-associated protein
LDEVGVIHMNGRIYDPLVGRFMSADPFIQAPFELQSHNRYAYVMNNPLYYSDPSGYFSLGGVFRSVTQAGIVVAGAYYGGVVGLYVGYQAQNNPRLQSLAIGTASVLGCGPWAAACNGAGQGMLASSYGASEGDAWNIGARAAFTAEAFVLAGQAGTGADIPKEVADNSWARYGAHAAAGCVTSAGRCSQGAVAAMFGKWATNQTADWGLGVAQFSAAVVAGGVGSVIAGGKFTNGARTGAYGYLYNNAVTVLQQQAARSLAAGAGGYRGGGDISSNGEDGMAPLDVKPIRIPGFFGLLQSIYDLVTFNSSDQPNEKDLIKVPEKDGNKEAQGADYDDAHDAKKGRGRSSVNIYVDKGTKQRWLWNGVRGSEKEPL